MRDLGHPASVPGLVRLAFGSLRAGFRQAQGRLLGTRARRICAERPGLTGIKSGHARCSARRRSRRVMGSATPAVGFYITAMEIVPVDVCGFPWGHGRVAEARMAIDFRPQAQGDIVACRGDAGVKSLAGNRAWRRRCVIRRRLRVSATAEWKQKQRQTCDREQFLHDDDLSECEMVNAPDVAGIAPKSVRGNMQQETLLFAKSCVGVEINDGVVGAPQSVMQAAVHTKDIQSDTANAIHAGGFFHLWPRASQAMVAASPR